MSRYKSTSGHYSRYGPLAPPSLYHGYGNFYGSTLYDYNHFPFTSSYDGLTVPGIHNRGLSRSLYGRQYRSMSDYGYRSLPPGYTLPDHELRTLPHAYDSYRRHPQYNRMLLPADEHVLTTQDEMDTYHPRYSRYCNYVFPSFSWCTSEEMNELEAAADLDSKLMLI